MTMIKDVFVRAVTRDVIQIGVADPNLPYAERTVYVINITRAAALALIGDLVHAVQSVDAILATETIAEEEPA